MFRFETKNVTRAFALAALVFLSSLASASAEGTQAQPTARQAAAEDPFEDLAAAPKPPEAVVKEPRSWATTFFSENFGFRKEIMSQFNTNEHGRRASRQSLGFEVLKKFSSSTATIASFDFQGRLVRRDGFNAVLNDMEGQTREGWAFEYHNLYVDLYNILNPMLSEGNRSKALGKFNFRVGRFYVPFGLNLQTDTHGAVLQLSNDRNFGFERDWYTGFWGTINKHLNYDAYYLAGSGYDLKFRGQSGLGALRISLSNKYSSEYGLEGGVSAIAGERLSPTGMRRANEPAHFSEQVPIATERFGADARYRRAVPKGLLTFTTELSRGRDSHVAVSSHLHQAEYLHSSRRWGVATQYRRFGQDGVRPDSSIIGELSWYLRNDVGNSNLHWIKLNVERQLRSMQGPPDTIVTLQYYFYR